MKIVKQKDFMNQKNNNPWIQTYTGQKFYLLSEDIDSINIEDIAIGLSREVRFSGQINRFYSVAEHSWLVKTNLRNNLEKLQESEINKLIKKYDLLDKDQLLFEYDRSSFLHDAHEAYSKDNNTQVKKIIPQIKALEKKLQKRVFKRFELKIPFEDEHIKTSDLELLISEKTKLFNHSLEWELDKIYKPKKELLTLIYGYYPESAKEIFMDLCKELYLN